MYRLSSCLLALIVLFSEHAAMGQTVMPRAGRDFSFGIIEGADSITLNSGPSIPSQLTLTVLSPFDGTGVTTSPSGYTQAFSFKANRPTILDLPHNLTHQTDLGKTSKGISVHTSQPVNLVLEDSIPDAGDATQIYPDNALDTSYVVSEWGLFNDVSEGNRVEFLITASEDSTHITIVPSCLTMMKDRANQPIHIELMKGECYMVKADSLGVPIQTSLSGSTVTSDKPVSVIVGATCAYVPLGVESCNELMDELVGRKWWGNHFFVQLLGNGDTHGELLMTSDTDFLATINGTAAISTGKRLICDIQGVAEIFTSSAVEMHQLTRGSIFSTMSDPTLVSILPVTQYSDTMMWNAPHIVEADNSNFTHWMPIIYPTAESASIFLDGVSLASIPVATLASPASEIQSSIYSGMVAPVGEGFHTLTSPVPVFALAVGFQAADAYSFIPGTIGIRAPPNTTTQASVESDNESSALVVSLFPNPSASMVNILGNRPLSHIALVDPLGRVVRDARLNGTECSFNVEGIAEGTYFVVATATSTGATVRKPVVIMH